MTLTAPAPISDRAPREEVGAVSFTASWPPVAAWGAGLITAALGAGAIVGPGTTVPTRSIGVVLVTLGLGFLVWGAVSLRAGRMLVPRAVITAALGAVLAMTALLLAFPAHTSVFAVATATALLVVMAACAASTRRRAGSASRPAGVWGLLLAAAVLSVIVTPALGATQDAVLIRDDGTVPVVTHGH